MLTLSESHEPVTYVGANNLHAELGLEKQKDMAPTYASRKRIRSV